jgi:acyl transferase domain-containing protein
MVSFGSIDDGVYRPASADSSPTPSTTAVTPVAVIGMACRLPGGIDSPEQLWEALLRGDDLVTEIPPDRWDGDEYYDPESGPPGRSASKWGAFLDDVAGFDAEFFGINEREAVALDPQHRLLLETSWEAMEHAGLAPQTLNESLTGVFVGLTHFDYQLVTADSHAMEGSYGLQGSGFGMASARIAHALGLHGPALTVDCACSSGLLAVHMACRSLDEGESDLALAGSACVMLEPRKFAAGSAQNMLSPTGRCHAFDAAANGYVCGEACAVVLLKRLPDALRDRDRILAVVRGTAANQDGRTENIATPSETAQTAVYRAALAAAGVDPRTVGMVEAHGPGTPVGDPIEYAGLAKVYGVDGPCALASVKTNFGHTQSASGGLGLMKTVLALQRGVVPRNLHFTRLPDELARIDSKLFVPQASTPWPTSGERPRRAAVSSYGLSGTNVHAILEQPPAQAPAAAAPEDISVDAAAGSEKAPLLFPLSCTSAEELRRTAGRLADWVQAHEDVALPNLAYTLARRRTHRSVRTVVIASSRPELTQALREISERDTPYQAAVGSDDRAPVWVFSGQGSQWAQMGAALLADEPVFAATAAQVEPLIAHESGFSVTEAMSAPQVVSGQDRLQPTLFAMQVALAATMKAYGVRPGAVIGHSLGEAAAAVVAGALSMEDGVRVICRRSRLMARLTGAGASASVELPAHQVLSELATRGIKDVAVAAVSSPDSTVIAGATETVRDLVAGWEQRDVMAHEIPTDVAVHSPQVDPILAELKDALAEINPMTPKVPFYSATLFDPREQPVCDASYWMHNMRRMVRFAAAVRAAVEDGHRVFAELAPHPLLTHTVEQTARSLDTPLAALAGMRRQHELPHGLLGFVADLHSSGAAVDFSVLYPSGRLVDAPLPTWTHRRLWLSRGGQDTQEDGQKDRVLAERLLTIEWQQRQLPELAHADAGAWLLVTTTSPGVPDVGATRLSDALTSHGARCTSMCWPHRTHHSSNIEQLGSQLRAGEFTGVVILMGPTDAKQAESCAVRGREYVQHLVHITRALLATPGEPPRLYVVTRTAQTVLAGERPNLEHAGLRGLIRVISAEHPHLGATHIDTDEATDAEQLARQLLDGSEEDETAWRNGQWYTARLHLTPLLPEDRRTTVVDHERAGMCLQIFRRDGAYLITGGLGGPGLFLAEKMASGNGGAGCGRIVLSSRSQPTLKVLKTIETIRAIGADVVVQCGDIAEPITAQRLVAIATATGLPLRGVLHAAAAVNEDATLTNITDELIEYDWAPKVYGAWNLHRALQDGEADQPLDWFCSFSSVTALVGSPGQGAYAAANSWLDAFTMWRRAQGLPATAIAWGAWAPVGRGTAPAEGAGVAIAPDEGAYAFEALLRYDRAYTGYAAIMGTPWLTDFAQRSLFAEAFRSRGKSSTGTSKLRTELNEPRLPG